MQNIDPVVILFIRSLVVLLFLETAVVMVVWTRTAPWWKWGAGRSIMVLLGSLLIVFGLSIIQFIFGIFPGYIPMALGAYVLLLLAIGQVGWTIILTQREDRRKKERNVSAQ